ncbi:MAG: hypothetical protein CMP11_06520 [Zetaproteobacteria bacterium]|nr:hypothetical protein [Pseudobdellovibrionaceae bacterium]
MEFFFKKVFSRKNLFFCPIALLLSTSSLSAEVYKPPKSPELYDNSKPVETQIFSPTSATFLGVKVGLGQSRSDGAPGPVAAYEGLLEFGYQKALGSWNLWEIGLEYNYAAAGHSQADMTIPYGFLAKAGYSYYLAKSLMGKLSLGGGVSFADYSNTTDTGDKELSVDTLMGTKYFFAFDLDSMFTSNLIGSGGLRWNFYQFNLKEVKVNNDASNVDRQIKFNVPEVVLGLRYLL